jgi:hypothetical protein
MVELKLKGLAERGKPDPGSAHTADSGGRNPSFLGKRWVNVPSFRVADEMFWLTIAPFCWLGARAHEVIKELCQQADGIITEHKSNVKRLDYKTNSPPAR